MLKPVKTNNYDKLKKFLHTLLCVQNKDPLRGARRIFLRFSRQRLLDPVKLTNLVGLQYRKMGSRNCYILAIEHWALGSS